jgi:HlyD family secretion protein
MYDCRVDEIAPEANRQKATVQVKVKFLKPDLYVKPEMNARVTFRSKEAVKKTEKPDEKFYVLPKSVVVDRDGSRAVFVVADGVVAVKPVTVAKEVGAEAYISNGLIGGESVISGEALAQVKAGDKVQTGK